MKYKLFLFDADDTLLDFRASERFSFEKVLNDLKIQTNPDEIFKTYRTESFNLWCLFERGQITKEFLREERYRKCFEIHKQDTCAKTASNLYLEFLSETVLLKDYAVEICQFLSARGEIGIVTNGIEFVQKRRLQKSALAPYISFVAVSEECGFPKPDVRFFEYSVKRARSFSKETSLMIGDRLETDVQGAHDFGIDACFYNPEGTLHNWVKPPKYEIKHLSQLKDVV